MRVFIVFIDGMEIEIVQVPCIEQMTYEYYWNPKYEKFDSVVLIMLMMVLEATTKPRALLS
jgi:hypothetical protein